MPKGRSIQQRNKIPTSMPPNGSSTNRQHGFNMFQSSVPPKITNVHPMSIFCNCMSTFHEQRLFHASNKKSMLFSLEKKSIHLRPWCCFRAGDSDSALSLAFNGSRSVPVPKLRARGPMTCGCFGGGGLDVDGWFLNMIFCLEAILESLELDENIMGSCG